MVHVKVLVEGRGSASLPLAPLLPVNQKATVGLCQV